MTRHRAPSPEAGLRPSLAGVPLALACLLLALLQHGCDGGDPLDRARELQARGDFEASLEPLREHLDATPDDPEAQYRYGVALTTLGRVTEAVWPLRRAAESPDWTTPATIHLASISVMTTDWDMATQLLDPLLEREPDNEQARLLRAYARSQSRQDYEGALADADAVLETHPDSSDALVIRAVALLGLERIDEAGEAIEAASSHFEESGLGLAASPRFCAVRALFAKEKGELETAEERFDECTERFPAHFLVIDEAVKFFDGLGRSDRSLEIIRKAYSEMPGARNYRLSIVHRLMLQGDLDEAEQLMVEATESDHPYVAAAGFSDLAGFYFEQGRIDESIAALEKAAALVPDPGPEFYFAYADALVSGGRYDEALALADRMEMSSYRELVRGRVALERDQPAEALAHFEEGLRLWPANAVARYMAAQAAERIGDYARAIEEYRYSIRADAGATDARMRLARLYLAAGDPKSAIEVVRHDARKRGSDAVERALLELELLARLDRGDVVDETLLDLVRPPRIWGRAVAARARGKRIRFGPEAAVKSIAGVERLDLRSPFNAPALESLTTDLIALDRADEAFRIVDRALAANGNVAAFHAIRGRAIVLAGQDAAQARAAWNRALELDLTNTTALKGLARLDAAEGETESALQLYDRAARSDEADTEALAESASLLIDAGRREEAEAALDALLDRDPYDGAAALRLARLMLDEGSAGDDARIRVLLLCAATFGGGDEAKALLEQHTNEPATAANAPS